jgi:hypothetical protein
MNITESDEGATGRIIHPLPAGLRPPIRTLEVYREVLLDWVQKATAYMIFFVVLQIAILTGSAVDACFIPLFGLNLKVGLIYICKNRSGRIIELICSKEVIDEFSSALFKILLLVHMNGRPFNTIFIIIPIVFSLLNQLFHKPSKSEECLYLTWLIITICKGLFLLTVLNVSLKEESILNWTMAGVFWPVYIGICICGVLIVGIILFTLGSVLSWASEEVTTKELISTIWLLFMIVGITLSLVCLCMAAVGVDSFGLGKYFCVLPASVLLVFIITTCINLKSIVDWWVMFFTQNNAVDSLEFDQPSQDLPEQSSIQSRIISEVKKAPKFLMRISSNYFKPAENPENPLKRTESLKETSIEITVIPRRTFSGPSIFEDISEKHSSSSSSQKICEMCCENNCNAVIMECGHGGICYECSLELWKTTGFCHMCRGNISQVLQIEGFKEKVVKVKSTTRAVYETDVVNAH